MFTPGGINAFMSLLTATVQRNQGTNNVPLWRDAFGGALSSGTYPVVLTQKQGTGNHHRLLAFLLKGILFFVLIKFSTRPLKY